MAADLPDDILMDIFSLLEIPDLMRASSVCASWRAAYGSLLRLGQYKRAQTPCLFYTSASDDDERVACLYSLAENKVYKLTLPDPPIRRRHLIGSSHGWLVTADERSELHMVNPITGEQVALPSVATMEHVKPITDDAGVVLEYELSEYWGDMVHEDPTIHSPDGLRDHLYFKAFVFLEPSMGGYIVVLIHNPFHQLSFAREGDCKWTWLPPGETCYEECIYMDGLLYALTASGGIDVFDLSTGSSAITRKVFVGSMKCYIHENMYIVQAPWGDVLQVWREQEIAAGDNEEDAPEWDISKILIHTKNIHVYRIDMATKELVEINGLQDHVLFLGNNKSQCLSSEEYPHLKANHVYFTDDEEDIALSVRDLPRDIGVFNLENNSREEIAPPQLWSGWPSPIWITPNLTIGNLRLNN
ncbi:uncharacterized protein LOC121055810 [Oryza brachyantha]|uniref:F-box domain-containing protein n=1 Tax=Oryza brachyantha TaxID=4533 RepID=J3N9F7_ORYBR|nr:uncharacterized protein LOC102713418 [Oryza brachyantha]XP_040385028.1 uncharacterized protein LOC121055804 [Oryza brachyantha]XP_040385052.1 uncharacterized protein LOC121055810 [Oryza brachyantha]